MNIDFVAFAGAGILAFLLTFLTIAIAKRSGSLAEVRKDRWHRGRKIPRLGGPAVLLALLPWVNLDLWLVLAGFCAIGVFDDHRALGPAMKGALLLLPSAAAAWVTEILWVMPACWLISNALNMLDHADGIVPSTCLGSLLVLGGNIGATAAGASLGFLGHNWPPARSFLGDGGSLMLGALLVLAWCQLGVLATLGGVAVPLLDACFVVAKRLLAHSKPWVGGTDHTGHMLLRIGVNSKLLSPIYAAGGALLALTGKDFAWA